MKFDKQTCWKHANCRDAFFSVYKVIFDDNGTDAILVGTWCVQGIHNWWYTSANARIKIAPEHYNSWYPYNPYGPVL